MWRAGMILERLDGHGVNKPIEGSAFCDVGLLQEQLFCIFNALDIGQKALGFHHSGAHAPAPGHTAHLTRERQLRPLHALARASAERLPPGASSREAQALRCNKQAVLDRSSRFAQMRVLAL